MPFHQRKILKNHFVIGFVPFGATFSEFIRPFLKDVKKLEAGTTMKINGIDYLVTGGLGIVTADLPQGNDLCGVKRHGAQRGCRNCFVSQEQLSDKEHDHLADGRYLNQIKSLRERYKSLKSSSEKSDFLKRYGLSKEPSPLSSLQWNPYVQTPQDSYHAISGKISRLLESTLETLSADGKRNLNKYWKSFEFPANWSRMQNPVTHFRSFYMSEYQRLVMIFPFILQRFLTPGYIKNEALDKIKETTGLDSSRATKKIIECWVRVAASTKLVFSPYLQDDDYRKLNILLYEECECLLKVSITFI
jgi:hypothetical protein